MHSNKYLFTLSIIFFSWWLLLAIEPYDRHDWLLENILVVLLVAAIGFFYKKLPLSKLSYTLIFVFLMLHEIGSHYTYAKVPYDAWTEAVFGRSLNSMLGLERNHFDRLLHFCYGLLLVYPVREIFVNRTGHSGFWSYFFPVDLIMSTSMLYELIEWAVAEIVASDLGMAYLGTQGDIWDAHKDMGLASLGALLSMMLTALIIKRRLKPDKL